VRLRCGDEVHEVVVRGSGGTLLATVAGRELRFTLEPAGPGVFVVREGARAATLHLAVDGTQVHLSWDGVAHTLEDEREGGRRALLNYGHTLGHALEVAGRFDLRHGEAVAIGLVYAAEVAHVLGRIDAARVERHREVVDAYGLSPALPAGVDRSELLALMARDKKALDGYTFVLDGPRGVEVVAGVERGVLEAAFARMGA